MSATKPYQITDRKHFPKCVRHIEDLKGISVGECIAGITNWGKDSAAHAHTNYGDSNMGWVCLKHKYLLKDKWTLLHEVAHLIANKYRSYAPHGEKWRKAVVAIGGTYKPYKSYNGLYLIDDYSSKQEKREKLAKKAAALHKRVTKKIVDELLHFVHNGKTDDIK